MRRYSNSALLVVGVALLAANLVVEIRGVDHLPAASGAEGDLLIAASNTQNEAFCFLYDRASKRLVSYMNRSTGGLQLVGIRSCEFDFNSKIVEYPENAQKTRVQNMKALAEEFDRMAAKRRKRDQ